MALKGYFIQATFEDGTEVSAYAAYDGTWYYFYTDRRFRFTLTSTGAVDIQQYQPIGSNMAWYDIDIITAVTVEQFDPENSGGGGTVPEDVYTKEEVQQLIAEAVAEVEAQIPDLVAQAVQEALAGLDDRYVLKAGDTMTGQLKLVYGNSTMSVASTGIRVWDTTDQSKLGNATIRVNIGGGYINLFNSAHDYMASVHANNKIIHLSRYNSETNGYTYESRMANTFWMLNDIDSGTQPVHLGYNVNGAFLYIRDPDNSCYTYISNDDMQMKVGSSNRVWIRNTADEGAFIAYDNDGNNTWYQPAQISAWTNGGTRQSLITPGADAIAFNKTVQVPSGSSFLISGACRFGQDRIQQYSGGTFFFMWNDDVVGYMQNTGKLTIYGNRDSTHNLAITPYSIHSTETFTFDSNSAITLGTNNSPTTIRGSAATVAAVGTIQISSANNHITLSANTNSGHVYIIDSEIRQASGSTSAQIIQNVVNLTMSSQSSPSLFEVNIISLGLVDALNAVINQIQDAIGTNFSASYSPQFLAGGGQTRGGGVGRGY